MAIACKLCIITKGLKGSDIASLPLTHDELAFHLERKHHVIAAREGESTQDALLRVVADGDACRACRESAETQLAL